MGKKRDICLPAEKFASCGEVSSDNRPNPANSIELRQKISVVLGTNQCDVSDADFDHFVYPVDRSIRKRKIVEKKWSKERLAFDDIIVFILDARDAGDRDEALWRTFLAAHFGRESASQEVEGQIESGSRLLCAFGPQPYWTWARVSSQPPALQRWLFEHASDLRHLSFGNHRKFEAKKPHDMWQAFSSFLHLVENFGGSPTSLFSTDQSDDPFDVLYQRLKGLWRFGRTGRFDFLALLDDLKLAHAEPQSCYLRGATGPLYGARKLWGNRPVRELDRLAATLASALDVSPHVIEDSLCNWQK